jgi:hypothetical protein
MSSKLSLFTNCPNCKSPGKILCGVCGGVYYCSDTCQEAHATKHKEACTKSTKPETAHFQNSFDGFNIFQLHNCLHEKSKSMEEVKKAKLYKEMEDCISSKDKLLSLVKTHCKTSEIEILLQDKQYSADEIMDLQRAEQQSKSMSAGKGVKMIQKEVAKPQYGLKKKASGGGAKGAGADNAEADIFNMDKQQQQQIIDMMRKNPDLMRKSNPMLAKMSNKELLEQATLLEDMLKNPDSYKAQMEQAKSLKNMSKSEQNDFQSAAQHIQKAFAPDFKMSDAWVKKTIVIAKTKTDIIKNLYKPAVSDQKVKDQGLDSDNFMAMIDFVCGLPDWVLFYAYKCIYFLYGYRSQATTAYEVLDKYTFGFAKNIITFVFIVIAYMIFARVFRLTWWVLGWVFYIFKSLYRAVVPSASQSVLEAPIPEVNFAGDGQASGSSVDISAAFDNLKSKVDGDDF